MCGEKRKEERVLGVIGIVEKINTGLKTKLKKGKGEKKTKNIEVLTQAKTPPFPVARDEDVANEDIRLKYRFIDLRRPKIQKYLRQRAQVIKAHPKLHGRKRVLGNYNPNPCKLIS